MESALDRIVLYTYCKSSAAYRVRIALNLKNIAYTPHFVSLINEGGENYKPEYLNVNPQAMIPSLKVNNDILTQSSSIIEWLEENYPTPALLPENSIQRAHARSLAQIVACDIHPLNNLRVLDYIKNNLQAAKDVSDDDTKLTWYRHWIQEGFSAFETILENSDYTGEYCVGNTPGIADLYLIPQVYNAKRFNCDMNNFPIIMKISDRCAEIKAFYRASPEQQEDFC